jgi:rhodanese-related sulfurtransferase
LVGCSYPRSRKGLSGALKAHPLLHALACNLFYDFPLCLEFKLTIYADVREPHELQETGKIPGAINIPMTTAAQALAASETDFEDAYGFEQPPKDATLMVYCRAGVRARTAAALAQAAGWTDIAVYPGSWLDWAKQGGPVEVVKGGKGK